VLEALDPTQRDEVRALLGALGEPGVEAPASRPAEAAPTPGPAPDISLLQGLSPWLADRVGAAIGGASHGQDARMTPAAHAAVVQAAAALPIETLPALEIASPQRRRPSGPLAWIGRPPWA
jgi:hypothetical protein